METESLNWFRFSKCLVTVGTEVLQELLKFNIQTYSFSEYHKLWLQKVDLHGKSNGLYMLWTSLNQQYRTLDASSQQNLQSLFSKLKCSRCSVSMDISQQISVLKEFEDEIQYFMSKHPTQQNILKKWSVEIQTLATSNASLLTFLKTWTQEFINLCQAEQLNLLRLTDRHHERISKLSATFMDKLELFVKQGESELHNVFKAFKQDEVSSQRALNTELNTFLIIWQPKINKLLNMWITNISSSPHRKILQTLVMDLKNCLPRVYQMCHTSVLGICSTWHKNIRTKLAAWDSKLHQVGAFTSDQQDLAKTWCDDLQVLPSATDQQIRDFFDSRKPDFKRLRTCQIITDSQWSLLYPANGYIDLRKFDIALLSTLHRNIFPLCPPELGWGGEISDTDHSMGADLTRLKKFRNDYIGHITDPILITSASERLWTILEASLLRLSKALDEEFKEKVNQKVAESKTCLFDFREEIKLQLELINWHKDFDIDQAKEDNFEQCLRLIQTIHKKAEKLHQQHALNMPETNEFKTKMDNIRKEVIERLPRIEKKLDEIKFMTERMKRMETTMNTIKDCILKPSDKLSGNEMFERIGRLSVSKVNQTKLDERICLMRRRIVKHKSDNVDVHVRTRAFAHAKEILSKHNHLVVQGKPGEGKTYLGLSLVADLTEMYKERQPVIIYDTNDWQEIVDMTRPLVVFLDDVLGKCEVSETNLDQWIKISKLAHPYFNCGSIFLIICIRTQIASAIKLAFQRNDAFSWMFNSDIVDISNERHCLTKDERKEMLMKYHQDCIHRNDTFTVETILGKENLTRFPQNCKIFRSMKNLTADLQQIFTNNMFLINEIQCVSKKSPEIYTFLVLLMLSGGSLSLQNKTGELENKIKTICNLYGLKKMLNIVQIRDIGDSLCDMYVVYNQETTNFSFQHDCIETAVFISFGKDYPDVTLRLCSFRQLSQMCCVKNESDQFDGENPLHFKIRIDDDQFSVMCERFNEGLESGERETFENISEALIWKTPLFVDYFANKMTSTNDVLKFLSKTDPDGQSLLIHLIYAKNTLVVERIIQIISHCDLKDHTFVTRQLLLTSTNACLAEDEHMLNTLIELQKKADDFVMFAAASTGNISVMKMLIRWGGNINATLSIKCRKDLVLGIKCCSFYPKTPSYHYDINLLHIACSNGKTDIVKYLMSSYPELVHRRSSAGHTACHFAALSENVEILKLLHAEQTCIKDQTVQVKLQAGLNIAAMTNDGAHVLHIAAENDNLTVVKYLTETRSQLIKQTDKNGWTVVHSSAVGGSVRVINTLIEAGLDITTRTNNGANVLHIAAENDNLTMVQYLIETHSQLAKQATKIGWTAVHYAAKGGSVPLMKTILQAGLDISARTNAGLNVLHTAAGNDNLTIVKYLIATNPQLLQETDETGCTAVHFAALGGSVHVMETLIQAGLDTTVRNNDDYNVLHIAAGNDNLTVVKYLIATYPQILQETDKTGRTALHLAAARGSVNVVETLIQAGLDITARDDDGSNVLHIVAGNDNLTVVKYLIATYPKILQETDKTGRTALHFAAARGSVNVVATLIQAGLDITARDGDGSNALHIAALKDNLTVVKYLITTYPQILQQTNKTRLTALHFAAARGSVNVMETLIQAGLDITARTSAGHNVLHIAAENDNLTVVKYLIATYPQILQETDKTGRTVLHFAAARGSVNVMETLIQAGLDITARTSAGHNVLHIAAENDNLTVVKYLIATYPQILQETDKTGRTALHFAAARGSVSVVETLIQAGLDITARDDDGSNVLHIVAGNDNLTVVKYFITTCPQILQETNKTGRTAVHFAAGGGSVHVMETLIQAGLDITARTSVGSNVLHIAAENDNLTVVKYLITTYPQILQETNKTGRTAVHFAAGGGSVHVMETLIQAGLDITARDGDGSNALHIAALKDNLTVVKYLITTYPQILQETNKTGRTALHFAAPRGSVHVMKTLIQAGLDITARTSGGYNVLHIAAENDNLIVVKYLITAYPQILQDTNKTGRTALHFAAAGGSVHVMETLIQAGLDITARDGNGSNALHIAALKDNLTVVKYLIATYPQILQETNKTRKTALHFAAARGSANVMETLIQAGLDITARDDDGSNVLHIAALKDNLAVVKYFITTCPQMLQETNKTGGTAVHFAAGGGSVHVMETLIQAGLDITARTSGGSNVLHIAAENDNLVVVKYLITTYPQILQETNKTGRTAVHFAAGGGSVHVMETLIQAGLDITARDGDGSNALHIAALKDNLTVVKYLIATYPQILQETNKTRKTALHFAAVRGSANVMETLIQAGLDITARDDDGSNVLHIAALKDNLAVVKYFITTCPQILQETNKTGGTAVHSAAAGGSIHVMETLIQAGLDITARTSGGSNVLHIAAENDNLIVVKNLITTYPQILQETDKTGRTALHFAAGGGSVHVMETLIQAGLDITARDGDGSNALHIAALKDNLTVVKYLIATYPQIMQETNKTRKTALHYAAARGSANVMETLIQAGLDITARTSAGHNALHIAAENDNLTVVKYLIATYPPILQETNKTGRTAVHFAAGGGSVHVMETLIQAGLDITARDDDGSNVLHIAARNDNLIAVKYLIATYPQILEETNKTGRTALHFAAGGGSVHVMETLIQAGLDITARDDDGSNALHIAALKDNLTVVKYLIATYPQILQETNKTGRTAVHFAAGGGSVHVMETLIQAGLDITARTSGGYNVLHIAAENVNLIVVKYLITTYPQILQETNKTGRTAVHFAAGGGSVHVMETLIQAGLDITARDGDGSNALHIAALKDNLTVVKYLIATYPQILQESNQTRKTALHFAAARGSANLMKTLIQAGLHITARTSAGHNVLHIAAENDNLTVVKYLIATYPQILQETNKTGRTAVHFAAGGGSVHVMETLIQAGLDITARDDDGSNVLHIAAGNDNLIAVKYLITTYPQILEETNKTGRTALHFAAGGGSVHVMETLIQAGLDITARDGDGSNALHIAALKDNLTVVKYLIATYPQILQETNKTGGTAVHFAAGGGSVHVMETLIQAGLDITARTSGGYNVLHIAAENDNLIVVKYLITTYPQILQETNKTGRTALHSAAGGGSVHVMETLIQAGLDITARDGDGSNALHIAALKDNLTVVKYLIATYPQILQETNKTRKTALHFAAARGSANVMETLIQAGLHITARTSAGHNVLHIAAENDNLTVVKYLIATYPQILQETNKTGLTALHFAAARGSVNVVETLIQAGLDNTARDDDGLNVLHIAALKDNLTIVKYLIATYPQMLHETDKNGWTALHFAAGGGSVHVMETLIQAGLDITARDDDGSNVLHIAALKDNLTVMKYLITTYPQILQETNKTGGTAVHFAAGGGSVHVMETLIQAGLDITARTSGGYNVLHIAAENDNLIVVKYLITTYPQILQEINKTGRTAVHFAAGGGSVHVMETLIQAGLDITARDDDGSNALHIAALKDNLTVVKYLIATYPQILQETNKTRKTALHFAAARGSANVMETLIQAGLHITARTNAGHNVLHIAAENDNLTVVKYLIATYPQILQETNKTGLTALHFAAARGSISVVETLIQAGLDIIARDDDGFNVLHIAALKDNLTIVKYLIATYPQILHETDKNGWTALHFAAGGGSVHVMETLIQAGLDITARDDDGSNVLHIAALKDNLTVVKYLITTYRQILQETIKTRQTALHFAAARGSANVMETLIQAGLDITARTSAGHNVLHIAAENDNLTVVKYLIATYPQILQETNKTGLTALHFAAARGSVNVVETLIQAGLDITARDDDGLNVLHIAALKDNLTIVKYLIATYPQILHETDKNGWTALHFTAGGGSVHMMETLIEAGLDIIARTSDGYNVLQIATARDDVAIVKYLIEKHPHYRKKKC